MDDWTFGTAGAEVIATAPDFLVRREIEVQRPIVGGTATMGLEFDELRGRYKLTKLTVETTEQGREITGSLMRDIPLAHLTSDAVKDHAEVELQSGGLFDVDAAWHAREDIVSSGPSSDEAMLAVARTYRWAQIVGLHPAKLVESVLGLKAPTATLWIRRARGLGLLGDYQNESNG